MAPVPGTEGPATGIGSLLIAKNLLIAPVPLTVLIVGARADP